MACEGSLRESSCETRSETENEICSGISKGNPASETWNILWKISIGKGLRNTIHMCGLLY